MVALSPPAMALARRQEESRYRCRSLLRCISFRVASGQRNGADCDQFVYLNAGRNQRLVDAGCGISATGQNPALKWITGFVSGGATEEATYPCDVNLLPPGQSCGGIIPGQGR